MYRMTQLDLLKNKKLNRRISAVVSGIVLTFLALSDVSVAVEPVSASLTVDPQATVSTDRVIVTITGNYLCGPLPQPQQYPNSAQLSLNLIQAQGRDIASGGLSMLTPQCDGVRQTFEYSIVASSHPWHGGPARVTGALQVQACDQSFNCQQSLAQINSQVKIQGGGQ